MCKIFTLTNMSRISNRKIDSLINTIADELTEHEQDGFGYAIQGEKGVFGERTTEPESFLTNFSSKPYTTPFTSEIYNRFGEKSRAIGAGIFHGRTSTNQRTLINTHPISQDNWHLIHNGVVTNHGPQYEMLTTNDTEHLLYYLKQDGTAKGIETHLTGYYAIAAFDPQNGLHIIKDNIASLFVAKIEEIDSLVFATTANLIINVCAEMGWTHTVISKMQDNNHLVFLNNTLISHTKINPRGETRRESMWASKSLGREISELDSLEETVLDQDQASFITEIETYADHSYTFLDFHKDKMSFEEFMTLTDDEKFYCTVIRPDGTICSPYQYDKETLYTG